MQHVTNNNKVEDGGSPRPNVYVLTQFDRDLLEFEGHSWRHSGAKEEAVNQRFGISLTRYYQHLNRLIDVEAALAVDPVLINRLRRMRDDRLADISFQARKF